MGVNIGSFLAMLSCGYVGQNINWHYGFGLAGIGMLIGLIVFWCFAKSFGDKGLPPKEVVSGERKILGIKPGLVVMAVSLAAVTICALMLNLSDLMSTLLLIIAIGIIGYLIYEALRREDRAEGQRIMVVIVLFFFHAVFWALFEQAGGSITIFTEKNIDRTVMGSELPSSIFQSFNALYIILLAPLFSYVWIRLNKAGKEPSTPMKFVLGLVQLALGYGIIVIGAKYFADDQGLVSIVFLALMYLFHTTGELSLSPVGLSMVTKLSPGKIVGFVMGAWFLSMAVGNKMAGWIGTLTATEDPAEGASATDTLSAYTSTYLVWGVLVVIGAAVLLFIMVPTLRKWMNGIH